VEALNFNHLWRRNLDSFIFYTTQLQEDTMLSRALRTSWGVPLRRSALSPLVKRTVTTDAASAHADKDEVPEVASPNAIETVKYANLTAQTGR